MISSATESSILSIWNQCNYRNYISVVLCFPFDKTASSLAAADHIKAALQSLRHHRPEFAASLRISAHDGLVHLERQNDDDIPFTVADLPHELNNVTHDDLRARGFPLSALTHSSFTLDANLTSSRPRPTIQVRMSFIQGGIMLFVRVHHTFADGDGMRMALECLAACTRGDAPPRSLDLQRDGSYDPLEAQAHALLGEVSQHGALDELLTLTPELIRHAAQADPLGFFHAPLGVSTAPINMPPETTPRASATFVFCRTQLDALRSCLGGGTPSCRPSAFVALAALTWAHATSARARADPDGWAADPGGAAQLLVPVDWRARVTRTAAVAGYFGNACVTPIARASAAAVLRACDCEDGPAALASLAALVGETIRAVDEAFVARRGAVMTAAVRGPDGARSLALNHEPRNPRHLTFNSWRRFGADATWSVPGVGDGVRAAAVRPARGVVPLGSAHILPGQADSGEYELNMGLPAAAMDLLMRDEGFMRWVSRVVV